MVIEAGLLAHQLVAYLAPFIPRLLQWGGEEVGKTLLKKGTEEAYAGSKELWAKLSPKVEADAAAREAAEDVAANPNDGDAQTRLRLQLKKLLSADPAFAAELAALTDKHARAGNTVQSIGERSVAIDTATEVIIHTGDVRR